MTKQITLSSPRFRVVLGDPADPETWAELEVQSISRDLAQAESLFARRKWGETQSRAITFTAVTAYYALLRTAQIDGATSWDQFDAGYVEVTGVDVDEVGPTGRDPETD